MPVAVIVAMSCAHFIPMKITVATIHIRMFPTVRRSPMLAMTGIKAIVYMTMEAPRAMEPGTCSDEDPAGKPLRPIVAVRCAAVWSVVVITIRTSRLRPDRNRNLGLGLGHRRRGKACNDSCESERFQYLYWFTSQP
jgi:hypothetical protein